MSLICLSFSHQTVPIAFRERVYFSADATANACARFRCGNGSPTPIVELVILSTCNRTELFAFTSGESQPDHVAEVVELLYSFMEESRGVSQRELNQHGRAYSGIDAVRHLYRVSCGLESLVLGEPQILGQVGDAMRFGLIMNSAGPVLTRLFQAAIRAGRRARSETEIGRHSLNISTVAVNTAQHRLGGLQDKTVVVLGAGEMADLALLQLRKKGVGEIKIANRTLRKARELAEKHDGQAYVFEQLNDLLPQADVLITSTSAPHTLITKETVEFAMQIRPTRPMVILDIAVPRDVDIAVEEVKNIHRCDVDDLHMSTGESVGIRKQQIPKVQNIIDQEIDQFMKWFRGIGIESTITSLRKKADTIREAELEKLAESLTQLDSESWQSIQHFAQSLINKVLHDPTTQLRQRHGTRDALDHGEAIRQLFRLVEEPSLEQPGITRPSNLESSPDGVAR